VRWRVWGEWPSSASPSLQNCHPVTKLWLVSQPADVAQVDEAELLERAVAGLGRMAFFGITVLTKDCHESSGIRWCLNLPTLRR
jgi:hypothetical protein